MPVTVRVENAQSGDQFLAAVNGGAWQTMTRNGLVGTLTATVPTDQAEHTLAVQVQNSDGQALADTQTRFTIKNMDNVPLAVTSQVPANGATGVEPNAFIALYFNKAIDPALLSIEVLETAIGQTWAKTAAGADITQLSNVRMTSVENVRSTVAGGLAFFPENSMAAFYPEADFTYGGTVFADVSYDGKVLARSTFAVRPLPTLVQGFVTDQFQTPLEGIRISIPSLGKSALTDKEGSYNFGFGQPDSAMIPAGRYRAVANADRTNAAFGSIEFFAAIEEGRLNTLGAVTLPFLDPRTPFRHAQSRQGTPLPLDDGNLTLDLGDADLVFPDGDSRGAIHVQFTRIQDCAYQPLPAAYPSWVYAIQPGGIEVNGTVTVAMAIPKLNDSHDYVAGIGERVIIVALDPDALQIVPVGIGLVDADLNMVTSERPLAMDRLDIIGYAVTASDNQELLARYARDEITLQTLIRSLQAQY